MIGIDVRQNGKFDFGFPYNNSVDDYFRNLSDSFVSNYGLSEDAILKINDHKNTTLQFDRDLHTFIFELSEFIFNFNKDGQPIIDEFERLRKINTELHKKQRELSIENIRFVEEYEFAQTNINRLQIDISRFDELMNYYLNKIIQAREQYSASYIFETELELNVINSVLIQNEIDYAYYQDSLSEQTMAIVTISSELTEYSFYQRTLRVMFEEWKKRTEPYFVNLCDYFREEYDDVWPYGVSLMFGQKEEQEKTAIKAYHDVSKRWQASLFKGYKFRVEKALKEYSLIWMEEQFEDSYDEKQFQFSMANKKMYLLEADVQEVESIVNTKEQNLGSIFSHTKEQNYFKYRELMLTKLKYLVNNYTNIDQTVLDGLEVQLQECKGDYLLVYNKKAQRTYWDYLSDLKMYKDLLKELRRKLQQVKTVVNRGYIPTPIDNEEDVQKAEFYAGEKEKSEQKVQDLIGMQDDAELEKASLAFEMENVMSQIFNSDNILNGQRTAYKELFDERVEFYSTDENVQDSIISLLKGKNDITKEFVNSFNEFSDYIPSVLWYVEADREKLKQLYTQIINMTNEKIMNQWKREYSHDILNPSKAPIYKYYFESEMRMMFAFAHKHFLEQTYSESFVAEVEQKAHELKKIFKTYTDISFDIKQNMVMLVDMFEYEKTFEFNIEDGLDTKQSVLNTFDEIVTDIIAYVFAKNLEFKMREDKLDKRSRINQVWMDMEKKYV